MRERWVSDFLSPFPSPPLHLPHPLGERKWRIFGPFLSSSAYARPSLLALTPLAEPGDACSIMASTCAYVRAHRFLYVHPHAPG